MLEIRGISKAFSTQKVLNQVDLKINPGEFFSLLGPSGCGKTTLLRIVGGFEDPSTGEIALDGRPVDYKDLKNRPFNMVFQRYALFPHLNVYENCAFGLRTRGIEESEIKSRVMEALNLVQMEAMKDRNVSVLSGGQQQRVALARAIVNRPKVLLLDEPLSALDLKLRQQMQIDLCALQRRLNITFIFVTHDQEEALRMSDRIAVMRSGYIEQVGTPQEIYDHPCTPFVADFIGAMNYFPCKVVQVEEKSITAEIIGGYRCAIHASLNGKRPLPKLKINQDAFVMVRPENMYLSKELFPPDRPSVPATIKEILYKGQVTEILVETPIKDVGQVLVSEANGSPVLERYKIEVGEQFYISWDPDDTHAMSERYVEPKN